MTLVAKYGEVLAGPLADYTLPPPPPLQMGWKIGKGLGTGGEGIVNPVKASRHTEFGWGKNEASVGTSMCAASIVLSIGK